MEPCTQCEAVSKGFSSSHDSLQPGDQCCGELSLPILRTTASHNAGDTTQPDDPDTLWHVFADALEDTSSKFDTATTSIGLPETKEASPATLAPDLASFESEDFEMWLKAFGASPNIEYGLIEPGSAGIPLFTPGEIHPMLLGNPIPDDYYHTDAAVDDSLPSSYPCLAYNTPYAMNVNSPSAQEFLSITPGFDDFEKSKGSETRYQLIKKLAPAAQAQFMTQQQRTTNNEHLLVPATQPRKRRQCFDPMKREKVKQVRRLGACLRCRIYKEPVSSTLDLLSTVN